VSDAISNMRVMLALPDADAAERKRVVASKGPGTVMLPQAQYEKLLLDAEDGRREYARVLSITKDRVIEEAVESGRFTAAAGAVYRRLLDVDPQGALASIEAMPPGLIPRDLRRVGPQPDV
jgi:hypothetical protein